MRRIVRQTRRRDRRFDAAKADDVKMGYINKMGEHPWFVSEVAGAKAEAGKLGVNLMTKTFSLTPI